MTEMGIDVGVQFYTIQFSTEQYHNIKLKFGGFGSGIHQQVTLTRMLAK